MLAIYVGAASAEAAPGETLDANNLDDTPNVGANISSSFAAGQTFTAEHSGALTSAEISLTSVASPPVDLTVQIANVDATSGLPTVPEDVLASATIPSSSVTSNPGPGFDLSSLRIVKVNFDAPASVVAGKQYALLLKAQTGGLNPSYVAGATFADTYSGGTRIFQRMPFESTPGQWEADPIGLSFGVYDTVFAIYVSTDTTPPKVSSTDPPKFATGVPATANISATFIEEGSGIDPDTISPDTFKVVQVKPTGNVQVQGNVTYDAGSKTATFDPSKDLAKGLYRVTLHGVADNAGNVMPDYTWTFATAGPSKK
jgi:hypothetical protein